LYDVKIFFGHLTPLSLFLIVKNKVVKKTLSPPRQGVMSFMDDPSVTYKTFILFSQSSFLPSKLFLPTSDVAAEPTFVTVSREFVVVVVVVDVVVVVVVIVFIVIVIIVVVIVIVVVAVLIDAAIVIDV